MEIWRAQRGLCCSRVPRECDDMERARERLRDVTAVVATARATYSEHNDSEVEASFPEYLARLQERKHALQEEVLKYLGLQWVAPSPPSPPSLPLSRSGESGESSCSGILQRDTSAHEYTRARVRQGRSWVRREEGIVPQRLSTYDNQRQITIEQGGRLQTADDEHAPARLEGGAKWGRGRTTQGHNSSEGWNSSRDHRSYTSVESVRGVPYSWGQSPDTSDVSELARVTPPRLEDASMKRNSLTTQGRGVGASVTTARSPSPNTEEQFPAVVASAPATSFMPVDRDGGRRGGGGATHPWSAMPLTVLAREDGYDASGQCLPGSRLEPEDINTRRAPLPSLARVPSLDSAAAAATASPHHSSESDQEDKRGDRRSGDACDMITPKDVDDALGLRTGRMPSPRVVGGKREREFETMPTGSFSLKSAGTAKTLNTTGARSGGRFLIDKQGESTRREQDTATPAPKGSQACRDVGCHRRPIYAFQGDTKALCCPIHRSQEMVNVRHPLCRHESCFRQPSFGIEGDKRASFCSEHKLPEMINVSSRRCRAPSCLRHPNFGFQGDRRATFCCRHKAPGMVDVVSRRCKHPQCARRPLYAMTGQRAMYCRTHKDPGMTDVVSRRCNYEEGCDRHPSFGWKQVDGKARRCAHHRLEGMESVKVVGGILFRLIHFYDAFPCG